MSVMGVQNAEIKVLIPQLRDQSEDWRIAGVLKVVKTECRRLSRMSRLSRMADAIPEFPDYDSASCARVSRMCRTGVQNVSAHDGHAVQSRCPECVVIVAAAWRVEVVQIVEFY